MNAREFCGMTDAAKSAHVATLTSDQRRALVDAVCAHHARANAGRAAPAAGRAASGVAGKSAATAGKATPAVSDAPRRATQGVSIGSRSWQATREAFNRMAAAHWAKK